MKIYKDIYNSCSYLEKEWWVFSGLYLHPLHPSWSKSESLFRFLNPHLKSPLRRLHLWIQNSVSWLFDFIRQECFLVERIVPLTGYTGIVKTTHCYKKLLETDPAEAERLFNKLQNRWDISMLVSYSWPKLFHQNLQRFIFPPSALIRDAKHQIPGGDQLTALLLLSPECPRHVTADMMAHWPIIFDLRCSSAKWSTWETLNLFQPIHDYHRNPITKQQNSPATFSSSA